MKVALGAGALALAACADATVPDLPGLRALDVYPRAYGPGDPDWTPQPHRDRPLRAAITPDGALALVTLQGLEDEPGRELAVVDLASRQVLRRIAVGSSPTGVAVHPGGRFAVVTTRYENRARVIDLATLRVSASVPVDFYATDIAFTPDGMHAWISNRWRDQVVRWDLDVSADRFVVRDARAQVLGVSTHPRDVAVSADGTRLAVAALDGMVVSIFALPEGRRVADVKLRAPVNDVLFAGPWIFALTQGAGSGHPPLLGPDTDEDGRPGDSTANSNFQDQQNEIAVLRAQDGALVRRYTSDTSCCRDWRDVAVDDPVLGRFVPPRELWIIGGSVPEAAALCGDRLWVTYLGSSEVETFAVDRAAGTLRPIARGSTPHGPTSVACTAQGAAVVSTLAESLSLFTSPDAPHAEIPVGDLRGGAFPATDQEIGELVNISTAPFSIDGDQSCVMCHREFGGIDKAFSMPLLAHPEGTRLTMAHRGLADTRPWFFEGAMDENNFFPVLNEFARVENFCCTDPALWPEGHPPPDDCETSPPPVCATRPWPRSLASRNAFYLDASRRVLGRARTRGDAFDAPLNFQGITRVLGLSLMHRSRLLPNPNSARTPAARRGEVLFRSREVGCALCHDGPGLARSLSSTAGVRVQFGPVISPFRAADGRNLDLVNEGFRRAFPQTSQDARAVEFGATSLRNIWSRGRSFLHDGRARSLREVTLTPGHPGLRRGERGFNETDGAPDTHGATSQLTPSQIDDLVAFMEAL